MLDVLGVLAEAEAGRMYADDQQSHVARTSFAQSCTYGSARSDALEEKSQKNTRTTCPWWSPRRTGAPLSQ